MRFDLERARRTTPARLGVGRAGTRPPTADWLRFQGDHAAARDAVWSTWSDAFVARLGALGFLLVASDAPDRPTYLHEPARGRRLAAGEGERVRACAASSPDVQVVLSDGLSARAAEVHLDALWPALCEHLARLGSLGRPVAVRGGRVAVADEVGALVGARLVVHLVGERPGLATPHSLGCYLTFAPSPARTDADRKCVSNIHAAGLAPAEAGATVAGVARRILERGSSGVDLVL